MNHEYPQSTCQNRKKQTSYFLAHRLLSMIAIDSIEASIQLSTPCPADEKRLKVSFRIVPLNQFAVVVIFWIELKLKLIGNY